MQQIAQCICQDLQEQQTHGEDHVVDAQRASRFHSGSALAVQIPRGAFLEHLNAWQGVMDDADLVRPVLGTPVSKARKILTDVQRK